MRTTAKVTFIAAAITVIAGVASAQPKEFKPPAPQVAPALDKVAMTVFVCDPSPIPIGTTQVTLRVTIKNVTGGLQGVTLSGLKIRVLRTNPQPDVLELETTVNNLAPGASQTVGAHVNVGPGVREYFARVDPDDILHEPIVQRANNESRLTLTIPAPPAPPQRETQLLDYDRAKSAGAQFIISRDGPNACGTVQYNVNREPKPGKPSAGVEFKLSCTLTGGSANAEPFASFRLKNGWKVKSFDVFRVSQSGINADWRWARTPSIGSDDPSSSLHMWAEPGSDLYIDVKIEVEGPAGTNPYQ